MADAPTPPPQDAAYVEDVTGTPRRVSQGRLSSGNFRGSEMVSEQTADEASSDAYAKQVAQDTYGDAGQFGMGFFNEGLGLGLPGAAYIRAAEALGHTNEANEVRRLLRGSQQLGSYQAGGVAGMIAPMFFGEGPANGGVLGLGGSLTERLAAKLLPESVGLMGSISKTGLKMAARGATEGAMIGLAQQLQQSAIRNVPLTTESMLASGVDGALLGGLAGGTLGAGGAVLGKGAEALSSSLAGSGERGMARQLQRLGLSTDEIAAISAREGGAEAWLTRARTGIGEAGETWSSKTGSIAKAAEGAASKWEGVARNGLETLDREAAAMAPDAIRVRQRMTTEFLAKFEGTPEWKRANKVIRGFIDDIMGEEHRIGRRLGKAAKGPINDFLGEGASAANTNMYQTTWSKWAQIEDQLSEKYDRVIGRIHDPDAVRVINRDTLVQMRDVIRSEMRTAMEAVETNNPALKGIADEYGAARLNQSTMKELSQAASRRGAAEFAAGKGSTFTAPDIAQAAGLGAIGQYGSAVGLLAGKGLIRRAGGVLEPHLAEMAWKNMSGAQAGATAGQVTQRIRGSVSKFFSAGQKAAGQAYSGSRAQARAKAQMGDRNAFERNLEATRALLSEYHRQKVTEYANQQSQAVHPEMGQEIMDRYTKAAMYLQHNIPAGRQAKEANSLRKQPKVKGYDLQEMKYLRIEKAIKNPLSILDGLEDGSVSRDAVRAVKYVYPELHGQIVEETTQQIYDMKSQGKYMPMDKVATLGIVLDAPVDSILEQSRISSIQASFVPPAPPQGGPPPPPPQGPGIDPMLQTPVEMMG